MPGHAPAGCGDEEDDLHAESITSDACVVLAWCEVGLHFMNPNYTGAVFVPFNSTVLAQVVERANPPSIVSAGWLWSTGTWSHAYTWRSRGRGY